jgi:hypothetical protein
MDDLRDVLAAHYDLLRAAYTYYSLTWREVWI